jgi:DNA-binding CsgD family transcriptional regulator
MHRLPAEDLRAVLQLGHEASELTEFGQLGSALERVARLVGSDTATLTHLDLETGHEVALLWPPERATAARLDAYVRVGHTHPLRPVIAQELYRRAGQRLVPRISDLLSARQWRSQPIRSVMSDLADQMTVALGGRRPVVHAVTVGAFSGPFRDRQRDLLSAAGPLLSAPLGRVSRAGYRALQIAPRPLWVPADDAPSWQVGGGSRVPSIERVPRLPLSTRELEVLRLVADGATDAQVARRLGLQTATVSKHLTRIYARLEVPNRAAAVRRLTESRD